MYDLAVRPPPVGSLRDALFLTVRLRRDQLELARARLLLSGFADMIGGKDNGNSREAFKMFAETLFPFQVKDRAASDAEMKAFMQKEVAKGPLLLKPLESPNPLRETAKRLSVPDDFRKKLQQRGARELARLRSK